MLLFHNHPLYYNKGREGKELFMMKRILFCMLPLCLLSSCTRYYRWGKQQFTQVDKRAGDDQAVVSYLRSVDLYDEFQTVGMFDALWLSEEVRLHYIDQIAKRFALLDDKVAKMRKDALEENERLLSFYLVMTQNNDGILPELAARDAQATWAVVLRQDGKEYPVKTVTRVDLEPEYRQIFGKRYSRYRTAYKLDFNRYSSKMNDLFPTNERPLELVIRSAKYNVSFSWRGGK
jgi:hypothetical protein